MKNKTIFSILAVLVLSAFITPGYLPEATIHAILFIEDSRSEPIYESCQKDATLIREELQMVENHTYMRIKYYPTSFNKNALHRTISSIMCNPNDVILFYYNGHGYNRGDSDFPCLNFNEPDNASTHINLMNLHTDLKGKGARLVLTFGDCCNGIARTYMAPLTDKERKKMQYVNLFQVAKGDAIIASSKKGQFSYVYSNGAGSYFTLNLLKSLHKALGSVESAKWKSILENVKVETATVSDGDQVPYFLENIRFSTPNTHED